jgi:hypothetical protein
MDPLPVVKKTIICGYIEPWETIYMLFMLPGLIIWIVGAIWCFRKINIHGAVLLQVLGALEIAIGGITAFIVAIREIATYPKDSGGYDPVAMFLDVEYYGEIPIIGIIANFVLLAITLILVIRAKRNRSQLIPTDNNS